VARIRMNGSICFMQMVVVVVATVVGTAWFGEE
jgi:hypothetical protein